MNNNLSQSIPVAINAADDYDLKKLTGIISGQFDMLGIGNGFFSGKNVVIKPNLVMKKSPEHAITTSPVILDAVLCILDKCGCRSVTIAESSGGPYTKQSLEAAYNVCRIREIADKHGASLNYDTSYREIEFPEGKTVKSFNIITPIAEADTVINLPRLKTHSLTGMSGAVKNFFGVIPGLQKFEMHARFPDYIDFASMLNDLAEFVAKRTPTVNILDAIVGMEGNGPTGGTPRKIGCILTSLNPFAADRIANEIISAGEVLYVKESVKRGFAAADISDMNILGDDYRKFAIDDFKRPDSKPRGTIAFLQNFIGGRIGAFFSPHPHISSRCIGCGECERSCPKKTISIKKIKGEKCVAHINFDNCIRCFCCQELCPMKAIDIKTNSIISFINRARKS